MPGRKIPSRIKEVNIFLEGYGFFGTVDTIKLPAVKTKKEQQLGQHVDTGILEPMEFEAEVNITNMTIFQEVAKLQNAKIKAKGSYQEDGSNKAAVATLSGPMDAEMDTWKSGDAMKTKIKMYVNVYHLDLGGDEVIDIDLPNFIAKIGGTDIYEQVKAAVS